MGVHTLYDPEQEKAAMFCSVTGAAFGPTFDDESPEKIPEDCEMLDAHQLCDLFQKWLGRDARQVEPKDLEEAKGIFLSARQNGMYPKLNDEGCKHCGNDLGHHKICPEKV